MSTAVMSTAVMRSGMATPRLRLTRRGRAVVTALAALPLIVAALAFGLNGGVATATSTSSSTTFQYVTVEAGQSLWQLALEIAPSADPREVISDVVQLNQLSSADVQAGQRLAIPVRYSH
jgi:LysM repeat protein